MEELTSQKCTKKFLSILKNHHEDTYHHSLRVAQLSIDLALDNSLPLKTVKLVGEAALLHDYGKSKIDSKILSKCDSLTQLEKIIMERHSRIGEMELKRCIPKKARKIIATHHKPTHKLAQIVSAADMYDALSTPRSYKEAFALDKVIEIMHAQFAGKKIFIHQLYYREPSENHPKQKTLQ